jgi:hypothetical protein
VRHRNVIQCRLDGAHHAFDVAQHVIVPESQHAVAVRIEKIRPYCVSNHLLIASMLSAIELNDETQIMICEICKVGSDRRLAAEVGAAGGQTA